MGSFIYFVCVYMCTPACLDIHHVWRPEEGVKTSGTGVTGGCKSPGVSARNRAQVLCKKSKCS